VVALIWICDVLNALGSVDQVIGFGDGGDDGVTVIILFLSLSTQSSEHG
jgi:hypothetical protein